MQNARCQRSWLQLIVATSLVFLPGLIGAQEPNPQQQDNPPQQNPQPDKTTQDVPPVAPVGPAAPKLEGFAVQVGAFKEEAKLQQAHEKLAAARIPHYVERRGDLNRLRAGPYPTREAAERALASVKAASLEGQVVPLP